MRFLSVAGFLHDFKMRLRFSGVRDSRRRAGVFVSNEQSGEEVLPVTNG